jgi:lipoprotein-anchoring transpeptidase ErfK/SrfK
LLRDMKTSRFLPIAIVLATGLVGAGTAAAATKLPTAPTAKVAWTAEILHPVEARKAPKPGSGVAMKLKGQTNFTRGAQVLLVLGSAKDSKGNVWIQVNLPKRPNGSKGWVPEEAVQLATTPIRIKVSLGKRTVTVLRSGKARATYKVAVGKPGTPTAKGLFAIADPVPSNGQLGPYILVMTAYSDVLKNFLGGDGVSALHGWGDSSVMGQAASNGCVRMTRDAVAKLAKVAKAGTPVEIVA